MGTVVKAAAKAYHIAKRAMGIKGSPDSNPFPIDAWTDASYASWFEVHKATEFELEQQRKAANEFRINPMFSFIVPLYRTPLDYLRVMSESVLGQTYENLQLVLVNASPELPTLASAVHALEVRDSRVTVVTLEENLGITENTNAGIAAAMGDFCCFLDHDDYIDCDLLFEYVKKINERPEIDFLYCDEDLVIEDDKTASFSHRNPFFKPDYSPELLLCKNGIIHLMTIRKSIIEAMPKPGAEFDGSQDYNMALFCSSAAQEVCHVPRVMYHWRISENSTATNPDSKPYSLYSCRKAQATHFERQQIDASIVSSGIYLLHNPWFKAPASKVSVVVDIQPWLEGLDNGRGAAFDAIDQFLEFFLQNNSHDDFEILLVGHGVDSWRFGNHVRTLDGPMGVSHFSRLNIGASHACGEYLIFLDAGCSFDTAEPIEQLLGLCSLEGVGVAAPKILYRGGRNKMYGIAVTSERIMPLYRGYEDDFPGYQCNLRAFQNVSACGVQGLTISRELFERIGGFDERFESEVGAADLCHRVLDEDLRVAQTCTVKLRTSDVCPDHFYVSSENAPDISDADIALFDEKWPGVRKAGDPYYNVNLDQMSEYCQIAKI